MKLDNISFSSPKIICVSRDITVDDRTTSTESPLCVLTLGRF